MLSRQKVAALVAEFIGTGLLTLVIITVQRSTIGVPFFVAAGAALAYAVGVYAFFESSGAHFNPALTIGMWAARKVSSLRAILYIAAQILGGLAAWGLYTYFVNSHMQSIGGHYTARVLIAEAFGTAVFSFGVTATLYKRFSVEGIAAFTGIAYMVGILLASPAAIGLLNPAVALGDRAWVWGTYVLGPVIGGLVGVNLYNMLFARSSAVVEAAAVTGTTKTTTTKTKKKTSRKK